MIVIYTIAAEESQLTPLRRRLRHATVATPRCFRRRTIYYAITTLEPITGAVTPLQDVYSHAALPVTVLITPAGIRFRVRWNTGRAEAVRYNNEGGSYCHLSAIRVIGRSPELRVRMSRQIRSERTSSSPECLHVDRVEAEYARNSGCGVLRL